MATEETAPQRQNLSTKLGLTRASYVMISVFFLTLFLIGYIWWPLAEEYLSYIDWQGAWWQYMDWLLIGIFLFMSLSIMTKADLRRDAKIVFVGLCGGLVIESWGTQTNLWFYYTAERPPLWIIPAWPIASLSIDRLTRLLERLLRKVNAGWLRWIYWLVFAAFLAIMIPFVAPTFDKPLTWMALLLCVFLILTPGAQEQRGAEIQRGDEGQRSRLALLNFAAGSGLGYFLEVWGTTRECWTYYTYQTPPLFAVLAHGMAALAFWRAGLLLDQIITRLKSMPRSKALHAD